MAEPTIRGIIVAPTMVVAEVMEMSLANTLIDWELLVDSELHIVLATEQFD